MPYSSQLKKILDEQKNNYEEGKKNFSELQLTLENLNSNPCKFVDTLLDNLDLSESNAHIGMYFSRQFFYEDNGLEIPLETKQTLFSLLKEKIQSPSISASHLEKLQSAMAEPTNAVHIIFSKDQISEVENQLPFLIAKKQELKEDLKELVITRDNHAKDFAEFMKKSAKNVLNNILDEVNRHGEQVSDSIIEYLRNNSLPTNEQFHFLISYIKPELFNNEFINAVIERINILPENEQARYLLTLFRYCPKSEDSILNQYVEKMVSFLEKTNLGPSEKILLYRELKNENSLFAVNANYLNTLSSFINELKPDDIQNALEETLKNDNIYRPRLTLQQEKFIVEDLYRTKMSENNDPLQGVLFLQVICSLNHHPKMQSLTGLILLLSKDDKNNLLLKYFLQSGIEATNFRSVDLLNFGLDPITVLDYTNSILLMLRNTKSQHKLNCNPLEIAISSNALKNVYLLLAYENKNSTQISREYIIGVYNGLDANNREKILLFLMHLAYNKDNKDDREKDSTLFYCQRHYGSNSSRYLTSLDQELNDCSSENYFFPNQPRKKYSPIKQAIIHKDFELVEAMINSGFPNYHDPNSLFSLCVHNKCPAVLLKKIFDKYINPEIKEDVDRFKFEPLFKENLEYQLEFISLYPHNQTLIKKFKDSFTKRTSFYRPDIDSFFAPQIDTKSLKYLSQVTTIYEHLDSQLNPDNNSHKHIEWPKYFNSLHQFAIFDAVLTYFRQRLFFLDLKQIDNLNTDGAIKEALRDLLYIRESIHKEINFLLARDNYAFMPIWDDIGSEIEKRFPIWKAPFRDGDKIDIKYYFNAYQKIVTFPLPDGLPKIVEATLIHYKEKAEKLLKHRFTAIVDHWEELDENLLKRATFRNDKDITLWQAIQLKEIDKDIEDLEKNLKKKIHITYVNPQKYWDKIDNIFRELQSQSTTSPIADLNYKLMISEKILDIAFLNIKYLSTTSKFAGTGFLNCVKSEAESHVEDMNKWLKVTSITENKFIEHKGIIETKINLFNAYRKLFDQVNQIKTIKIFTIADYQNLEKHRNALILEILNLPEEIKLDKTIIGKLDDLEKQAIQLLQSYEDNDKKENDEKVLKLSSYFKKKINPDQDISSLDKIIRVTKNENNKSYFLTSKSSEVLSKDEKDLKQLLSEQSNDPNSLCQQLIEISEINGKNYDDIKVLINKTDLSSIPDGGRNLFISLIKSYLISQVTHANDINAHGVKVAEKLNWGLLYIQFNHKCPEQESYQIIFKLLEDLYNLLIIVPKKEEQEGHNRAVERFIQETCVFILADRRAARSLEEIGCEFYHYYFSFQLKNKFQINHDGIIQLLEDMNKLSWDVKGSELNISKFQNQMLIDISFNYLDSAFALDHLQPVIVKDYLQDSDIDLLKAEGLIQIKNNNQEIFIDFLCKGLNLFLMNFHKVNSSDYLDDLIVWFKKLTNLYYQIENGDATIDKEEKKERINGLRAQLLITSEYLQLLYSNKLLNSSTVEKLLFHEDSNFTQNFNLIDIDAPVNGLVERDMYDDIYDPINDDNKKSQKDSEKQDKYNLENDFIDVLNNPYIPDNALFDFITIACIKGKTEIVTTFIQSKIIDDFQKLEDYIITLDSQIDKSGSQKAIYNTLFSVINQIPEKFRTKNIKDPFEKRMSELKLNIYNFKISLDNTKNEKRDLLITAHKGKVNTTFEILEINMKISTSKKRSDIPILLALLEVVQHSRINDKTKPSALYIIDYKDTIINTLKYHLQNEKDNKTEIDADKYIQLIQDTFNRLNIAYELSKKEQKVTEVSVDPSGSKNKFDGDQSSGPPIPEKEEPKKSENKPKAPETVVKEPEPEPEPESDDESEPEVDPEGYEASDEDTKSSEDVKTRPAFKFEINNEYEADLKFGSKFDSMFEPNNKVNDDIKSGYKPDDDSESEISPKFKIASVTKSGSSSESGEDDESRSQSSSDSETGSETESESTYSGDEEKNAGNKATGNSKSQGIFQEIIVKNSTNVRNKGKSRSIFEEDENDGSSVATGNSNSQGISQGIIVKNSTNDQQLSSDHKKSSEEKIEPKKEQPKKEKAENEMVANPSDICFSDAKDLPALFSKHLGLAKIAEYTSETLAICMISLYRSFNDAFVGNSNDLVILYSDYVTNLKNLLKNIDSSTLSEHYKFIIDLINVLPMDFNPNDNEKIQAQLNVLTESNHSELFNKGPTKNDDQFIYTLLATISLFKNAAEEQLKHSKESVSGVQTLPDDSIFDGLVLPEVSSSEFINNFEADDSDLDSESELFDVQKPAPAKAVDDDWDEFPENSTPPAPPPQFSPQSNLNPNLITNVVPAPPPQFLPQLNLSPILITPAPYFFYNQMMPNWYVNPAPQLIQTVIPSHATNHKNQSDDDTVLKPNDSNYDPKKVYTPEELATVREQRKLKKLIQENEKNNQAPDFNDDVVLPEPKKQVVNIDLRTQLKMIIKNSTSLKNDILKNLYPDKQIYNITNIESQLVDYLKAIKKLNSNELQLPALPEFETEQDKLNRETEYNIRVIVYLFQNNDLDSSFYLQALNNFYQIMAIFSTAPSHLHIIEQKHCLTMIQDMITGFEYLHEHAILKEKIEHANKFIDNEIKYYGYSSTQRKENEIKDNILNYTPSDEQQNKFIPNRQQIEKSIPIHDDFLPMLREFKIHLDEQKQGLRKLPDFEKDTPGKNRENLKNVIQKFSIAINDEANRLNEQLSIVDSYDTQKRNIWSRIYKMICSLFGVDPHTVVKNKINESKKDILHASIEAEEKQKQAKDLAEENILTKKDNLPKYNLSRFFRPDNWVRKVNVETDINDVFSR